MIEDLCGSGLRSCDLEVKFWHRHNDRSDPAISELSEALRNSLPQGLRCAASFWTIVVFVFTE